MWNTFADAERMRELIAITRRHGEAVGRDTGTIENSVMMPLCYRASKDREQFVCHLVAGMDKSDPAKARGRIMIGEKQECLDTVERYARAGVTHFIFMTFTPYMEDEMQRFAEEVIPAVR